MSKLKTQKHIKKVTSLVFIFVLLIQITVPAYASGNSFIAEKLGRIAKETISIETVTKDADSIVTTYTKLDTFIDRVHSIYPEISDFEIAQFNLCLAKLQIEGVISTEIGYLLPRNISFSEKKNR